MASRARLAPTWPHFRLGSAAEFARIESRWPRDACIVRHALRDERRGYRAGCATTCDQLTAATFIHRHTDTERRPTHPTSLRCDLPLGRKDAETRALKQPRDQLRAGLIRNAGSPIAEQRRALPSSHATNCGGADSQRRHADRSLGRSCARGVEKLFAEFDLCVAERPDETFDYAARVFASAHEDACFACGIDQSAFGLRASARFEIFFSSRKETRFSGVDVGMFFIEINVEYLGVGKANFDATEFGVGLDIAFLKSCEVDTSADVGDGDEKDRVLCFDQAEEPRLFFGEVDHALHVERNALEACQVAHGEEDARHGSNDADRRAHRR